MAPVGFKIVRVNVKSGVVTDFAVNKGRRNSPASRVKKGGLERPLSVKFDPAGTALYVVDYGILRNSGKTQVPEIQSGMVWKITREGL